MVRPPALSADYRRASRARTHQSEAGSLLSGRGRKSVGAPAWPNLTTGHGQPASTRRSSSASVCPASIDWVGVIAHPYVVGSVRETADRCPLGPMLGWSSTARILVVCGGSPTPAMYGRHSAREGRTRRGRPRCTGNSGYASPTTQRGASSSRSRTRGRKSVSENLLARTTTGAYVRSASGRDRIASDTAREYRRHDAAHLDLLGDRYQYVLFRLSAASLPRPLRRT